MYKKVLIGIAIIFVIILTWQYKLVYYGIVQAEGQLSIIWNAQPLDSFLEDETYPDSLKSKISFIQEVKEFAFDELGINPTDNYSSMFDQQGKPLMWVVTACEPFALVPKTWYFPIIGSFPYKGFFVPEMAKTEMEKAQNEGLDVGVRNPGGWSTLGWFNDPVLSEMLNRSEGQLAELIIHELTHSTIFIKDSVEFNENLASFIGYKGAILFLNKKYGESSSYLEQYLNEENDYEQYVQHFIRGASLLDTLYQSFQLDIDADDKQIQKDMLIRKIVLNVDTLGLSNKEWVDKLLDNPPNNTYFMSFLRYRSKQSEFEKEFNENHNQNLKKYIAHYKSIYPFL